MAGGRLDIILNTSHRRGTTSAPRIGGIQRSEFIPKCFISLVRSIAGCQHPAKLTIIDDHSGDEWLGYMRAVLRQHGVGDHEIVQLEGTGASDALMAKSIMARDRIEGLLYMVEDDYLHAPDAIQTMVDCYHMLDGATDLNPVAIYPFDSPGLYYPDRMSPTRLLRIGDRYWRGTNCASSTIFLHADIVRRYWPLWERIAYSIGREPEITEDNTINRLFNNSAIAGGPVCLFSPIPSLAVHLAGHEPMMMSGYLNDWKRDYDDIDIGHDGRAPITGQEIL